MNEPFMVFVPGKVPDGPYDQHDLDQRWKSGILPEATSVCRVGGEEWVPIATVLRAPASPSPAILSASPVENAASDKLDAAVKEPEPNATAGSDFSESYWLALPGSSAVEGPFQRADLQQRLASGAITEATMVCAVGGQEWVPIHTIVAGSGTAATEPVVPPRDLSAVVNTASERQASRATVEHSADGPNARKAPPWARICGLLAGILGAAVAVALIGLGAVVMVASQKDKAEPEFVAARTLEKGEDLQKTVAAFESARAADPTSKCGKRAAEKLTELEPKYKAWKQADDERIAEVTKAAAEADAAAAKIRYHDMAKKLNDKIHQQAMWDLGRGTVTNVIDVITGEMGQPAASYEGSYGAVHSFVWGAQLGSSPTVDQIQGAPFCARMFRRLTCGDYAEGSVEFYSYGQQLRFWLAE